MDTIHAVAAHPIYSLDMTLVLHIIDLYFRVTKYQIQSRLRTPLLISPTRISTLLMEKLSNIEYLHVISIPK